MFRTVPLSIIRSYSLYTQQWYMSYWFVDSTRVGSRWTCSSILLLLLESCLQTCMTYTIPVCTVKNPWWWTEELSETCTVSFPNKFEKLVHLFCFIIGICHDTRSRELERFRGKCSPSPQRRYIPREYSGTHRQPGQVWAFWGDIKGLLLTGY
jgi:hypothetical protein